MITAENRSGWQSLADSAAAQRPGVGKTVTVVSGKHAGKTGKVFWHGRDKFERNYYQSDAQLLLRQINGRNGFRVGILTDSGERFFVKGDNVTVLVPVEPIPEPEPIFNPGDKVVLTNDWYQTGLRCTVVAVEELPESIRNQDIRDVSVWVTFTDFVGKQWYEPAKVAELKKINTNETIVG